ncbi:hypothetical protein NQ318_020062 [Aromia moschata]|uniref:Uncharacterized protein n=1 Tax=Aromia moschata TaxID=1265417 RepID=A0AAV8Z980_9CUCU|nr:hypothetical protein NQ318_020062 [Aromia moschata]
MDCYYKALEEEYRNAEFDLSKHLSLEQYRMQIKHLLPRVKLDIASHLCRKILESDANKKQSSSVNNAVSELLESFSYKNLSREDCYEIGPKGFSVLNCSIKELDHRAGFLGDYFRLKIDVLVDGEERTLNLFAKYLPTTNQIVKNIAVASFL